MAVVNFYRTAPKSDGGFAPAAGFIKFTQTGRRRIAGSPDNTVLDLPFSVTFVNGLVAPDLAATGVDWVWLVEEHVKGLPVKTYAVTVPSGAGPFDDGDLTVVDPRDFTPVPGAVSVAGATDAAVAGFVNNSASGTRTALNAAFVRPDTRTVKGGQLLYNADHLRRWRAKLADAQNAQCHIGVYGDSISWGAYSNNVAGTPNDATFRTAGWVAQLRNLFANRYGSVGEGYLGTHLNTAASYMSLAGGAIYGGPSRAGILGVRAFLNAATQTATFNLPTCTTADITYYWKQGASGAFTYTVDGGASTASPTQTADGVYHLKLTGLSNATHTIVITGPASGYAEIIAVGAFTDTTKGVAVHRYGKSGLVLAQHFPLADPGTSLTSADQQAQINGAVSGLNTDLAIIFLSANNATQYGPLTPAQHLTGLQAVTANIVAQGKSILLVGGVPVNPAGSLAGTTYKQADYDANLKAVSDSTDHVAYLDLKAYWKDWDTANALGMYSDAIVHPTRMGHGDIANVVFDVLTRPY